VEVNTSLQLMEVNTSLQLLTFSVLHLTDFTRTSFRSVYIIQPTTRSLQFFSICHCIAFSFKVHGHFFFHYDDHSPIGRHLFGCHKFTYSLVNRRCLLFVDAHWHQYYLLTNFLLRQGYATHSEILRCSRLPFRHVPVFGVVDYIVGAGLSSLSTRVTPFWGCLFRILFFGIHSISFGERQSFGLFRLVCPFSGLPFFGPSVDQRFGILPR